MAEGGNVFDNQNALMPGAMWAPHAHNANALYGQQGPMPVRPMFDNTAYAALNGDHSAMSAFRNDWKDQRGQWKMDMHDWRHPMLPGQPQTNPGTQGPQVPNTQFPLNPGFAAPGVGSSYGVIGMNPATSPFGLPTY